MARSFRPAVFPAICQLSSPESFEYVVSELNDALARDFFPDGLDDGGPYQLAFDYFEAVGQVSEPRVLALAQRLASLPNFARLKPRERGTLHRLYADQLKLPVV